MPRLLKTCKIDDCAKTVKSTGLCAMHWKRVRDTGTTNKTKNQGGQKKAPRFCQLEDCGKVIVAREMCQMHYRRWDLYGNPLHKENKGNKTPARYKKVVAVGHPNSNADGSILEHRLVMSQMLERALFEGENVHHKNGDKFDNRPENLELWNTTQPAGQRPSDKVEYAIIVLKLYAPELLADES